MVRKESVKNGVRRHLMIHVGTAGLFPITLPNPEPLHIQTVSLLHSHTAYRDFRL